jgi:putative colanic acid biosynthesis glycosyltransferase
MIEYLIISINYNNCLGLEKTLESIRKQSYINYKVLVIDGNSQDDSIQIINNYCGGDDRFDCVVERDDGIFDAMNKGILNLSNYSSELYVIFLNSGDLFYDQDVLRRVSGSLIFADVDIIFGDSYNCDNGKLSFKRSKSYNFLRFGMHTHHQSIFYKSKILSTLRYDLNYKVGADYKLTAQFYLLTKKYTYINSPVSIFEFGGLNQIKYIDGAIEQFKIRRELFDLSLFINVLFFLRSLIGVNILRILKLFR